MDRLCVIILSHRSPYCTVAPASPRPKTLLCSYRITVLRTGFGLELWPRCATNLNLCFTPRAISLPQKDTAPISHLNSSLLLMYKYIIFFPLHDSSPISTSPVIMFLLGFVSQKKIGPGVGLVWWDVYRVKQPYIQVRASEADRYQRSGHCTHCTGPPSPPSQPKGCPLGWAEICYILQI